MVSFALRGINGGWITPDRNGAGCASTRVPLPSRLTCRDSRLHVGRIDLLVEPGMQLGLIEFAFPP